MGQVLFLMITTALLLMVPLFVASLLGRAFRVGRAY
jgi:hypothetical protein